MRRLDAHKKLIGTLAVLLLALPGAAAANDQIAKVQNLGDTLVFFPIVEFRELVLTVTGPCGFEYRQVVDKGEAVFRLDPTTIDGTYTFNLFRNESIDPGIVEILRDARAKLDEETPKALCREGKMPGPPLVQAASFTVFEGRIIFDERAIEKDLSLGDADLPAGTNATPASAKDLGIPLKDFVINDDLIVDGSACIGFDCVNGEVFGFDTVRLKENNLRIKFDDTSTAASFPRNDWQLTANDSANGGASKFSIDDISGGRTPFTVEANARSHSLYVDDGGRIGSRTSTPSVEIHTIDGDTPTLRLQQDGSSGFAPQTWDVAGNETNFFVRDVTNGSQLPFRIRPDAPSSSIFIDVDGDVGLGTSSPGAKLDVRGTLRLSDGSTSIDIQEVGGGLAFGSVGTAGMGNEEVRYPGASDAGGAATLFNNTSGNFLRGTTVLADTGGRVGIGTATPNASAMLDVNGAIYQRGGLLHADYVFEPDYELESIEDHAEAMWAEARLPAIGARKVDENGVEIVEIGAHRRGILEELEKAHIYITQLNDEIRNLSQSNQDLRIQNDEFVARLGRLEALLLGQLVGTK